MAVVDPEEPDTFITNRKRKRDQPERKLPVDQHVEVRSVEDGFSGSWHSGVVIACSSRRGHFRHVRYDHLLDDDESEKLVDVVAVSPILDGIYCGKRNWNKSYRGNIRPWPPVVMFENWGLHYGLCVDAYYNDAWWEGVIFDHDDGSPKRRVFFPDLGDEMEMEIDNLRITQDWNEVTEHWNRRGNWTFLELIEELENESCLPVSVKQIWYDMRERKDFKKVKEWTCTEEELWKKMLREVIDDYLDIIVKVLCPTLELSEDSLPEVMAALESAQPGKEVNMDPEAEMIGLHDILPVDNPVNSDVLIDQGTSALGSAQLGTNDNVDPMAEFIVSNEVLPVDNPVNNDGVIDQEAIVKNVLEPAPRGMGVNMDTETELNECYAVVPVDIPLNCRRVADVMNVYDCSDRIIDEPLQICDVGAPNAASLEPDMAPLTSMLDNDELNMNLLAVSNIPHHNGALCLPPQSLPMSPSNHGGIFRAGSDSRGFEGILSNTSDKIKGKHKDRALGNAGSNTSDKVNGKCKDQTLENTGKWQLFSSEMLQGAEFCPKAVDEYYAHFCRTKPGKTKNLGSLRTAVWKHILYLGWKCESSCENARIRKRFTSPEGRCFHSLQQVCKHLKESTRDTASQDDLRRVLPLSNESLHLEHPEESLNPDEHPQAAVFPRFIENNKTDYFLHPVMEFLQTSKESEKKIISQKRSEAKKHLFSVGWRTGKTYLGSGREVLCYKSPTGKVYYSPRTACTAYLHEEFSKRAASNCTLTKSLNVTGENEDFSTDNMPSPIASGLDLQKNLVQPNFLSKKLSRATKPGKVKVQGTRKIRKRRYGSLLVDASLLFQRQMNLHARRDGLKNSSREDRKLSHSKYQNSSLPKAKRSKKSGALINLRTAEDDTLPKRVLRSSKRVQEVAVPNSSHSNPRTVLSWLIDNNVVLPREKVQYRSRKDQSPMAEGRITRNGIKCSCCQKLFTLTGFEVHARSNYNKPAANIFLEDGRSLLDCQRQIISNCNMQSLTTESHDRMKSSWHRGENDYICSVCQYGGELMLCDSCPSSFHKICLGLKDIPDGDWFCPSCCCGICGQGKFQDQEDNEHTKNGNLFCAQCERKYHVGCMSNRQPDKLQNCHAGNWFCTEKCEKIFLGLRKLLGKPFTVGADNLTWYILKSMKADSNSADFVDIDALTESYSTLNVALNVMHECFEPVKDPRTERDLVEDIMFNRWSDLKRLSFQGFYTVLLVRNDELITVATISFFSRVYGQKVAEVPLVGTRFQYRRLGMCRILMNELEKKLMELGVERLVLPAVPSELNLNFIMISVKLAITLIMIDAVLSLKYIRQNKLKMIESWTKDNRSMSHLILTFGKMENENKIDKVTNVF
ncbi:Protein OBERON [Trema orientale]|uniref:Protein OBERON n=1 Tax=Trema orientale TaxID=63057 RepID=A0A2P5EIT0_TREOI|nr:Protein OBERON [Trema orientale]